jgi:hypothetical protein
MPIQVGEQPHGKSDALHHCEIGGPPSFWQETVEEVVLGQKVHAHLGELNTGYKLRILSWIGEADRFADIFINITGGWTGIDRIPRVIVNISQLVI